MKRDTDEYHVLMQSLGSLHEFFVGVDFHNLFRDSTPSFVRTPTYAWNKQRHWFQPTAAKETKVKS